MNDRLDAWWANILLAVLVTTSAARGEQPAPKTGLMGGIRNITPHDLEQMQAGEYVLWAHDRLLTKVPARKSQLPLDPQGHVQRITVMQSPVGDIFVKQHTLLNKSTDGGTTWISSPIPENERDALWQVRADGAFVAAGGGAWGVSSDRLPVHISRDEGATWKLISEIELPSQYNERYPYHLARLPDGTLLCGIGCRDHWEYENGRHVSGQVILNLYRSEDGGESWTGPHQLADWCHEGGITALPNGKLLAALRYQRAILSEDPPDILEQAGGRGFPYKHVYLADSTDGGTSWTNLRQLTTVFGQCHGYPTALSDGTVVVIHDTRYGPGPPSGRALISRDEGQSWEDEAYYLYYGNTVSGYSQSLVLDDGAILTVAGTCDEPDAEKTWDIAVGKSVLTAIRWKTVEPAEPQPVDISGARRERQRVLNQRRRIIFNDDTYEMSREDANTPEGFLRRRLQPLVGTHVDTISWSVLGGWADAPVYDSKVQPVFGLAHGGPPKVWSPYTARNLQELIQSGNDPLQVVIDFAHSNGMELFASIRMNDSHDSFLPGLVSLWKKEHPELLVDQNDIGGSRSNAGTVSYRVNSVAAAFSGRIVTRAV